MKHACSDCTRAHLKVFYSFRVLNWLWILSVWGGTFLIDPEVRLPQFPGHPYNSIHAHACANNTVSCTTIHAKTPCGAGAQLQPVEVRDCGLRVHDALAGFHW